MSIHIRVVSISLLNILFLQFYNLIIIHHHTASIFELLSSTPPWWLSTLLQSVFAFLLFVTLILINLSYSEKSSASLIFLALQPIRTGKQLPRVVTVIPTKSSLKSLTFYISMTSVMQSLPLQVVLLVMLLMLSTNYFQIFLSILFRSSL